jgi:DNA-binding protein H-NS
MGKAAAGPARDGRPGRGSSRVWPGKPDRHSDPEAIERVAKQPHLTVRRDLKFLERSAPRLAYSPVAFDRLLGAANPAFRNRRDRFVPESPAPASCGGSTINWTMTMKLHDLKLMTVDELWLLHLEVRSVLASRISADKRKLEHRLEQLRLSGASEVPRHERRPYPRVFPKYRNPAKPEETWAGRGKQPRWLTALLRAGKQLDDFRIQQSSDRKRRTARR